MKKIIFWLTNFGIIFPFLNNNLSCSFFDEELMNDDNYVPSDKTVDLADSNILFTDENLIYSYRNAYSESVKNHLFNVFKKNIVDINESELSFSFRNALNEEVTVLNTPGTYYVLISPVDSLIFKGELKLELQIIDDRVNVGKIDYNSENWILSTRNTVADLFGLITTPIYWQVKDVNYSPGDFLNFKIKHGNKIYTNNDISSKELLDVNNTYVISAEVSGNIQVNTYITGILEKLEVKATDERFDVTTFNQSNFNNLFIDNFEFNGSKIYSKVRDEINKYYTLNNSQSDYELKIYDSKNLLLSNDYSLLLDLDYNIVIDAESSKSKYLKGINKNLKLNIVDKMVHLENVEIDISEIEIEYWSKSDEVIQKVKQIIDKSFEEKYSVINSSSYLNFEIIQNSKVLENNEHFLEGEFEIKVFTNIKKVQQYFSGEKTIISNANDRRIDLSEDNLRVLIFKELKLFGFNNSQKISDFKETVFLILKYVINKNIENIQIPFTLEDFSISLDGYYRDSDFLTKSENLACKIVAANESLYIKNDLGALNLDILGVNSDGGAKIPEFSKRNIEFYAESESGKRYLLLQKNEIELGLYNIDDFSKCIKSIPYDPQEQIIDFKFDDNVSNILLLTKKQDLENTSKMKISFWENNDIVNSYIFENLPTLGVINAKQKTAFIRVGENLENSTNFLIKEISEDGIDDFRFKEISENILNNIIFMKIVSDSLLIQTDSKILNFSLDLNSENSTISETNILESYIVEWEKNRGLLELKENGLYLNNELICTTKPNIDLLHSKIDSNYKFVSDLQKDNYGNYYYLFKDYEKGFFSVILNDKVVLSIQKNQSILHKLIVNDDGTWMYIVDNFIYSG